VDSSRFDRFTREVAGGRSRRSLLKGVAGGLVAAFVSGGSTLANHKPDHCTKAGQVPAADKRCCAGLMPGANGRCVTDRCSGVTCTAPDTCHTAGTCNQATGQCSAPTLTAGTCFIGGSCYAPFDKNPANECQYCNPNRNQTAFSNVANIACAGGLGVCDANGGCCVGGTLDGNGYCCYGPLDGNGVCTV
jgi:hypothetical protein